MMLTPCAAFITSMACGCFRFQSRRSSAVSDLLRPLNVRAGATYSLLTHRTPLSLRSLELGPFGVEKYATASQLAPNWRACRAAAPADSSPPPRNSAAVRLRVPGNRLSPQRAIRSYVYSLGSTTLSVVWGATCTKPAGRFSSAPLGMAASGATG